MTNLLLILAALAGALFIILPLVERFAKPVDQQQAQSYHRIFMILMGIMMIALSVKFLMGS